MNLPAVNQIVTFAEGEDRKTITIPIITGAPNPGEVDVPLTMSILAGPPNAVLDAPAVLKIKESADVIPPIIVGSRVNGKDIQLTFSEPMDPARVQDVKNYYVLSTTKQNHDAENILGNLSRQVGRVRETRHSDGADPAPLGDL